MKKLVIGILAHVDAGKTTLAESMLYLSGRIRKLGRVDHKNAYLDTFELERARGITIFSKQAEFTFKDRNISLLDTPGHVDFSAEMERTLQVLDYAILVISGSDGVQGHTETLWRLLVQYSIPTFIFVNKMDMNGTDRSSLLAELKKLLNDGCVDFSEDQNRNEFMENLAIHDEVLLEKYIESGVVETKDITALIWDRKIFPCYFGAALKLNGVEAFLNGLEQYTRYPQFSEKFGAKVYKIARDEQGNRLTYMKITGGSLRVKTLLSNRKENGSVQNYENTLWEEKVDQIRIYSGSKYETVDEVKAGEVCAVMGLSRTYPGEGLGVEAASGMPVLRPVLSYRIVLPPECDAHNMLTKLRQLEEEDPQLHIVWSEQLKEIHVQLMGEIQIEILKSLILERFSVNVEFGSGNIVYKESILEPVEGVGHFEPLRHYAEVHLLMEPNEPGSGLIFTSNCSEDLLDRNWQRLILTHLEEKDHTGVLTGSSITDMKITLIAGRAHPKHTEGGDFRQATYRAVRQGLKKAKCVLLEPYYNFKLEIPSESVGRAMSDLQRMSGDFTPPELEGDMAVLIGFAPVSAMQGYQKEVNAYTRGRGRLFCTLKGYQQCHNSDEVIKAVGYDSEADIDNPTSSVFCANGAGFIVEWDKVQNYMHVDSGWRCSEPEEQNKEAVKSKSRTHYGNTLQEDKELEAIFVRTYGPIKRRLGNTRGEIEYGAKNTTEKVQIKQQLDPQKKEPVKEYLLVDGYNIIFSWDELNEIAKDNLEHARNKLMDILCNYQGFKQCILILVFDAYKVKGGTGSVLEYHNINVVYTKEAETADAYIEKVTHEIAREHHVTVATSDALEQLIILGQGAVRLSANDLKEEIIRVNDKIRKDYLDKQPYTRNYLGDRLSDNVLKHIKD
ncbi:translation factor GTPase family protein [Acetivibrio cellulolyticus]|uniref:translation factor GTPase family protein n=1 Tax=Acetivibrio cellulolyticus TaxID=35830 RepID=UPI0001E2C20A|nr:TetM/TetW/TetO/TetS family tetracycline resistance ribosomal protection protein [Acetivibrio cellulolyticus]